MFGRKKAEGSEALEGVVTFFSSYHVLRGEGVLKKEGFAVRLVPGPRAISPNCGVALRFAFEKREEIKTSLERAAVQYEAIHHYPRG